MRAGRRRSRRGGATRSTSVECPPGHGERPASDAELLAKWERVTGSDGSALLAGLLAAGDGELFAPLLAEAFAGPAGAGLLLRG